MRRTSPAELDIPRAGVGCGPNEAGRSNSGAYRIFIALTRPAWLQAGALGRWRLTGDEECVLSQALAQTPGVRVPIPGFGATDCRCGWPAHLSRESLSTNSGAVPDWG